jgi:hypothetical protein
VYADPKPHLIIGRPIRVLLSYGLLNFDCAFHGIHGADEIGKDTVACGVEDPTAMKCDQAIDDGPVRRKGPKRANLIAPHEAAVTLDIGCEDRRQLSFDPVGFQGSVLPGRV